MDRLQLECGCAMDLQGRVTTCLTHQGTAGQRCDVIDPGLGRCHDRTGMPHGHLFKPESLDPDLALDRDEARELLSYLQHEYLNPNTWPLVYRLYDRLADALSPRA